MMALGVITIYIEGTKLVRMKDAMKERATIQSGLDQLEK